jgi:probable phosphoglycerate mutase
MKLYILRHGNTFSDNEEPRRVGLKTDLPLVVSGRNQARNLGIYFSNNSIVFEKIFCSNLVRTKETAQIIKSYLTGNVAIEVDELFDEIDHGVDENKMESEVIKRIGIDGVKLWEQHAIEPDGWITNSEVRIKKWAKFFEKNKHCDNILIVTSNGSARYALIATGLNKYLKELKLNTGAFGILSANNNFNNFEIEVWNLRP